MNKISINLNPNKENLLKGIMQTVVSYIPLAKFSAGAVLILIVLLQLFISYRGQAYKILSKEWDKWDELTLPLRNIKSKIAALEDERKQLREIATPKYEIALLMGDIFSSLPKNIWLATIDFKNDFFVLNGFVVKWNEDYLLSLDKFIDSLKQKDYYSYFPKVSIQRSRKKTYNGVEVLEFTIQCKK